VITPTPLESAQFNGMAEALVRLLQRDFVRVADPGGPERAAPASALAGARQRASPSSSAELWLATRVHRLISSGDPSGFQGETTLNDVGDAVRNHEVVGVRSLARIVAMAIMGWTGISWGRVGTDPDLRSQVFHGVDEIPRPQKRL
jgi:hypothetical protein